MSAITITKLYDSLSTKLGKETAENLTTFIDNKIHDVMEDKVGNLATKRDVADTKVEIALTKTELKGNIAVVKVDIARLDLKIVETRESLTKEIGKAIEKVENKIDQTKTELTKEIIGVSRWLYTILLTILLNIIGVIIIYFSK